MPEHGFSGGVLSCAYDAQIRPSCEEALKAGAKIFRTDYNGTIVFEVTEDGSIDVTTDK